MTFIYVSGERVCGDIAVTAYTYRSLVRSFHLLKPKVIKWIIVKNVTQTDTSAAH